MSGSQIILNLLSSSWGNVLNSLEMKYAGTLVFGQPELPSGFEFIVKLNNVQYNGVLDDNSQCTITIPSTDFDNLINNNTYIVESIYYINNIEINTIHKSFIVNNLEPVIQSVVVPWENLLTTFDIENKTNIPIQVETIGLQSNHIIKLNIIDENNSSVLSYQENVDNDAATINLPVQDLETLISNKNYLLKVEYDDYNTLYTEPFESQFNVDFSNPIIVDVINNWDYYFSPLVFEEDGSVTVNTTGVEDNNPINLSIRNVSNNNEVVYEYLNIMYNNTTTFNIPNEKLASLNNGDEFDLFVSIENAKRNVELSSNLFLVDSTVPNLLSVEISWGNVLQYLESIEDGYVNIETENIEDDQPVNVIINNQTFSSTSLNNQSSILVPSSFLTSLQEGETYSLTFVFKDKAGNDYQPDNNTTYEFIVRSQRPSVSIISPQGLDDKQSTHDIIDIQFVFSSAPQVFNESMITVTNGQLTNLSGSGINYSAKFTPNNVNLLNSIKIKENELIDINNNPNTASNNLLWTYIGFSILNEPEFRVFYRSSYSYKPNTNSYSDNLQYQIINAPEWINLDNSNGNIQGSPKSEDEGKHIFTLKINDRVSYVEKIIEIDVQLFTPQEKKEQLRQILLNKKHPTSYSNYLKSKTGQIKTVRKPNYTNNESYFTMSKVRRLRRVGGGVPLKNKK